MASQGDMIARNSFAEGMSQDQLESLSNPSTYTYARNAINANRDHKGFGLGNEGSNELAAGASNIVGAAYCEERNWTVLFLKGDIISIFIHANNEIKEVVRASEFGCSWNFGDCEWIGDGSVEFKSMDPGNELYVYWSSGCDYYHINLDLMLDPARKSGLQYELSCETKCGLRENCEYFKNFKQGCAPKITANSFQNGGTGGTLKAGAYRFICRGIYPDGAKSNWFHWSDPANVGSEHNIAGEDSSWYIEVSISGLDCKFSSIELAVLEDIGGIKIAKTLNTFTTNNHHFTYRYNGNDGDPISVTELLIKDNIYLQGKYLEQKDGHMLYYGIKSRKNPNLQPLANGIITEEVIYEMPYSHVKKYDIKSFMGGETYAFGYVVNYIDGSHSPAFHIPSTPSGGSVGDQTSNSHENDVEYINDNAGLRFAGGFPFSTGLNSASTSSNYELACVYRDIDMDVDVTFSTEKVQNDYDKLSIFITGDVSKVDIIECINDCLSRGERTNAYIRDHNDNIITFNIETILDNSSQSSIVVGGISNDDSNGIKDAAQVTIVCFEGQSTGGGSSSSSNGGGGSSASSGGGQSSSSITSAEITSPRQKLRKRGPKEDSVHEPQLDHFDDIVKEMVDNMNTTISDHQCEEIRLWQEHLKSHCCNCKEGGAVCLDDAFDEDGDPIGGCDDAEYCCPSGPQCDGGVAYERCLADSNEPEKLAGRYENLLEFFNQDKLEPQYNSTNMHGGAKLLQESIKKRERFERKKREWNISKNSNYSSGSSPEAKKGGTINKRVEDGAGVSSMSGNIFDIYGNNETEVDIKVISVKRTTPDFEQDILYPCQTDCNGQPIYGGLAGSPVAHHKFSDSSETSHYSSKSVGVPFGTYFTDADETEDLYVRIRGVRFSNVPIPDESLLPLPLCPHNPYTIVMVKRTSSNRKVVMKGVATGTFTINNNGKNYDHPRYACNSLETVSYYHDDGNGGRLSSGGSGNSHTMYSLDGACLRPGLNADIVKEEAVLRGAGERYGLYAKGDQPEDAFNGRRKDALGARQSINLNEVLPGGGESDLQFVEYVDGDAVGPPGGSGSTPLMNRSGQPCIWFGSGLSQLTDESFTGDVLEHNVPIPEALGQYVSFRRELPNQYGNLENLNYIPILQAGKNTGGAIEGMCGDVYVGLYSFVKTGFVSDKVGDCSPVGRRFNIPNQVPTKEERRCICDGPEDVIHHQFGTYTWTELPEDGDEADPKNWAGTHTLELNRTFSYQDSVGQAPISDFYFPGTVTTNITYVGEFEACPWLREKSDRLDASWYSEGLDRSKYRFDAGVSHDGETEGWEDAYLSQFHREIEQPSLRQRLSKLFIRTFLHTASVVYGISNVFDSDNGGIDYVGNLAEIPFFVALWYVLTQVLFRNDFLDKILGIPVCKSDDVGGFKDMHNKGLFFNPSGYNVDYSTQNDLYTYDGMPDPYQVCDFDGCPEGANVNQSPELSNEIYISLHQSQGSITDSYVHVPPLSRIHIPASYGRLTRIFSQSGQLYAHTTDAMIPLRRGRTQVATDIGDLVFGAQGFLIEPEGVITEGIPEGYAGLKRHNEAIPTQYGYFFVDSDADIVYNFTGSELTPISARGMWGFFKEKLSFCNVTQCIDQKVSGTSYYSLGVDPRYNRFLITKSDGDYSFTLSYDLESNRWISFHDYIPRAYLWDRRNMYTINDSGIWIHNQDCKYQTYYGEYHPFEVEFAAVVKDVYSYIWDRITINSEADVCSGCTWVNDLDVTFNKIAMWNGVQGTGTLNLDFVSDNQGSYENMNKLASDTSAIKAHKIHGLWRINEFHDYRRKDCMAQPMLVCDACQPIPDINDSIFDCSVLNKQDFGNKIIAGKYFKYRFTYDLDDNTNLKIINVDTHGKSALL